MTFRLWCNDVPYFMGPSFCPFGGLRSAFGFQSCFRFSPHLFQWHVRRVLSPHSHFLEYGRSKSSIPFRRFYYPLSQCGANDALLPVANPWAGPCRWWWRRMDMNTLCGLRKSTWSRMQLNAIIEQDVLPFVVVAIIVIIIVYPPCMHTSGMHILYSTNILILLLIIVAVM